jgi:hypothetical protein
VNSDTALESFFEACRSARLAPGEADPACLAPAITLRVESSIWLELAVAAKAAGLRWCGFWAQESDFGLEAFSCLETQGTYLVLRTGLELEDSLPSIAPVYPAADRPERHHAAVLKALAFADGDYFALLGLFLGRIGDDDAPADLFALFDAFDQDAVMQWSECHEFYLRQN